MSLSRHASIVVVLLAASSAHAQTVWRCGPDGRSYSDSPCADGRRVETSDLRTASDQAEARAMLARDQRLARQLVAERQAREREALARGSGLAGIRAGEVVKSPASAKADKPGKPAKERQRRPSAVQQPLAGAEISPATGPGSRRKPG